MAFHAALLENPLALAQALIRCPSVTPHDGGALALVADCLQHLGFETHALTFGAPPEGPVQNLFALRGAGEKHFCFAGHTDVVPPGDISQWSDDPFAATVRNGILTGRGAADMKSAIAAFIVATARFLRSGKNARLSFLITGDEEGPALHGTKPVLEWMHENHFIPDDCLVGEPTSAQHLGDMMKIGRRGSLNASITVRGAQGHVAYPHRADNPVTKLVRVLDELQRRVLDDGTADFQPSNLEITDLHVGNAAENMIPAQAYGRINIRFNTLHSGEGLSAWVREVVARHAPNTEVNIRVSGEAFLTPPGRLSDIISRAVAARTGRTPELSTSGGTSDARFISRYCPVVEFGLVGLSMHKTDEHVAVADIDTLTDIYSDILHAYFA